MLRKIHLLLNWLLKGHLSLIGPKDRNGYKGANKEHETILGRVEFVAVGGNIVSSRSGSL